LSPYERTAPPPPSTIARALGLIVLATLGVLLLLFLQGWKAVPGDMIALHYSGGPIEGQRFQRVVPPGTGTRFYGLLEKVYHLPATQLNYIMSKAAEQGDANRPEFVGAPTLDKVTVQWETATYFELNTDERVIRQFFEQICLHYRCTDLSPGGGWERMVADTVRQQIVAAIQAESRRYTSDEIYADRETLLDIQEEIGSTLKDRLNSVLGGEFFCGPGSGRAGALECPGFTFLIKEVTVPQNVQDQYNANRASALAVEDSRHRAAQRRIEAEGEAARQAALSVAPELTSGQLAYIQAQAELECARREACVMVVGTTPPGIEIVPRARDG
jgi:regulator of protease activity HflC (stomatin/prohibitin superfamily)